MKTVNLLPKWYLDQQRQRRNLRVHLGIILLLGMGAVASTIVGRERIVMLEERRSTLAERAATVGDPGAKLVAESAELQRLNNLELAYRELGNTVPMSAVIQQIQNDMTRGMALSKVTIEVQQQTVKGSGFVGDAKHPPRERDVARIVVVGVAPNDVQIAQLIGKVSTNPVFSNVSLNYTHSEVLNEHSIRRFEIQMEMEMDRLATQDDDAAVLRSDTTGGNDNAG
jgi:hypothetical protein